MTKILIRGKQLRKVSLLVFIATVIFAIVIGLTPKIYSASGSGFFTFGDDDRFAELINKVANRQYQFNTPTTITYDKDTITQDPTTARIYSVYVNSLISNRITVFRYDALVP